MRINLSSNALEYDAVKMQRRHSASVTTRHVRELIQMSDSMMPIKLTRELIEIRKRHVSNDQYKFYKKMCKMFGRMKR